MATVTEEDLLAAIIADASDDARLVFADVLQERNEAQADLIVVQCELNNLIASEDRHDTERIRYLESVETRLLRKHKKRLAQQLNLDPRGCTYVRGFVEELSIDLDQFLPICRDLARQTPLRELTLRKVTVQGLRGLVAEAPAFGALETLTLRGILEPGASSHLDIPLLKGIQKLNLWGCNATDNGAQALASSSDLGNLVALGLRYNGIGPAGGRALASARSLTRLASLDLSDNDIGSCEASAIVCSERLPALSSLDLGRNRVGTEGAVALASCPALSRIQELALDDNGIGTEGAVALARSRFVSRLTRLDLGCNDIEHDGIAALSQSEFLSEVTSLGLGGDHFGDEDAAALAGSAGLSRIQELDLSASPHLSPNGIMALARSPNLPSLRYLVVVDHEMYTDEVDEMELELYRRGIALRRW
jgi:uncharacterized protein (TIGR02996 family)